jgi:hypothetical protein
VSGLSSTHTPSWLLGIHPSRLPLQVKVKKGADIIGQSIRAIGFRGRFNAAVIAVKRSKVRQPGRLGECVCSRGAGVSFLLSCCCLVVVVVCVCTRCRATLPPHLKPPPNNTGDLELQANDVLVLSTGHLFNPTLSDFTANFDK